MPSAFAHVLVPLATANGIGKSANNWRLLCFCMVCSMLPDIDVIAFKFGIAYASQWGHRGFTHSITVALIIALFAAMASVQFKAKPSLVFALVFVSTMSHGLLDMLTNGGLGIALFWPFSTQRYFFPYRPIAVSPIGIHNFFTHRAYRVITSEAIWVGLPALGLYCLLRGVRWLGFRRN